VAGRDVSGPLKGGDGYPLAVFALGLEAGDVGERKFEEVAKVG
jgi:hypothetical protein